MQGEVDSLAFFLLDKMMGDEGCASVDGTFEGVGTSIVRREGVKALVGVDPRSKRTLQGVFRVLDGVLTGVRNSGSFGLLGVLLGVLEGVLRIERMGVPLCGVGG